MENVRDELRKRIAEGLAGYSAGAPGARAQLRAVLTEAYTDGLIVTPPNFSEPVVRVLLRPDVHMININVSFSLEAEPN